MSLRTSRSVVGAVAATLLISSAVFAASVLASPAAQPAESRHPVVLTFTKWVTINPGGPTMQGFVGGDVVGKFAGQVLFNQTTDLVAKLGSAASGDINALEAVYEVVAGDHSIRALIKGGYDVPTNRARLDGVVLGGWLTGGKVHVEFQAMPCNPVQSNAEGNTCYVGTMRITPDSENES
jgi:hypothetical protein